MVVKYTLKSFKRPTQNNSTHLVKGEQIRNHSSMTNFDDFVTKNKIRDKKIDLVLEASRTSCL